MTKSEKAAMIESVLNTAEQYDAVYKQFIASGDDWNTALIKTESLFAAMYKGVCDSKNKNSATTGFTALFKPRRLDE